MVARYMRIIEFYQETKSPEQVTIARREIQYVKELLNKMKFFMELDFNQNNNESLNEVKKEIR